MTEILLLAGLILFVIIVGNAGWFTRERRRKALGLGLENDEAGELWRRDDAARRRDGIWNTVVILAVVVVGIWIATQLNVSLIKSLDAPTHPGGPLTNPWFLWDAGIMLLVIYVSLRFRGGMATALVLLLLVVMFVPYFLEVKDLPSVQNAWRPNVETYVPENWECDIQRAKHAAQRYPIDPLYRSCFR